MEKKREERKAGILTAEERRWQRTDCKAMTEKGKEKHSERAREKVKDRGGKEWNRERRGVGECVDSWKGG